MNGQERTRKDGQDVSDSDSVRTVKAGHDEQRSSMINNKWWKSEVQMEDGRLASFSLFDDPGGQEKE